MKVTQQQRILDTLTAAHDGTLKIDPCYIRKHPDGDGVSTRYFKQVLLISEANGRISDLRAKLRLQGMDIESSKETDEHGFRFQRLRYLAERPLTRAEILKANAENVRAFDARQTA